ncbi:MAG: hypothetical protein ACFE89_11170 [Candidatus Hodarchaeota archaeon]
MEPSTLLPLDGISEGYGLRDDALDQLLMTTGYREATIKYLPAIKTIQDTFSTDTRIRIIALPLDEDQDSLWPHMAWMPLWSNRDTCVLVADPLETPCRHDFDYLIPLGFTQFFTHAYDDYPYYLPNTTPSMVWPSYLDCQPVRVTPDYVLDPIVPHEPDDSDPTIYSIMLEAILRLRTYVADHILIERGFTIGVVHHYMSYLYELPLPTYPEAASSPWLLSFLLIDAARAINTLGKTDYLTWAGLCGIVDHARARVFELDQLKGNVSAPGSFNSKFDQLRESFIPLKHTAFRNPIDAHSFLCQLLITAGVLQDET